MTEHRPDRLAALIQLDEQIDARMSEARGTLKDLRQATREAKELAPAIVREVLEAEVKRQFDDFSKDFAKETQRALDAGIAKINRQLEELTARIEAPLRGFGDGGPSISALIEQYVERWEREEAQADEAARANVPPPTGS